ncbi:unnamed protein product [Ectocarpus sp. 13 AM-2016]
MNRATAVVLLTHSPKSHYPNTCVLSLIRQCHAKQQVHLPQPLSRQRYVIEKVYLPHPRSRQYHRNGARRPPQLVHRIFTVPLFSALNRPPSNLLPQIARFDLLWVKRLVPRLLLLLLLLLWLPPPLCHLLRESFRARLSTCNAGCTGLRDGMPFVVTGNFCCVWVLAGFSVLENATIIPNAPKRTAASR